MKDPHRVQNDPNGDNECLSDKKGRGAEKPREGLCPQREPVVAEDWCQVDVRGEEAPMVLAGLGRDFFFHVWNLE
jgi:hypothetical protein